MDTSAIRDFTLWARGLLIQEIGELLLQLYGLANDGTFLPSNDIPAQRKNSEAIETRKRLEKLIEDEKEAGIKPDEAIDKLVKEVSFTHLNRLVALKMLEHPGRRIIQRSVLAGYLEANGFKMYLPEHPEDYDLYEMGTATPDELDESARDRAYRHFLLWQYGELAKEVRVLFDIDNLASRLFPRPKVLRQVIGRLNAVELKQAWEPGNEETIGWVYQFFIANEKAAAFDRVFKKKQKFQKNDIPAATQVFTPRWIVKFLVQNSLGRLWLSMHPDSDLGDEMEYLVPLANAPAPSIPKSIKNIKLLDPATGTMHFGLVAFDLLVKMYREEIANVGGEGWPSELPVVRDEDIPAAILANNLFGIDIDLRAVQLSALALYLRAKTQNQNSLLTESNLACADVVLFRGVHRAKIASELNSLRGVDSALFNEFCDALDDGSLVGSLVRLESLFKDKLWAGDLKTAIDDYVRDKASEGVDESYFGGESAKGLRLLDVLMHRYDVVFTNPPYMSNRNMNSEMSGFMKCHYKKSKGDLYAGFIERCVELLADGGWLAMITQQSFMFISSYENLRELLLSSNTIETMAHVGPRAFDEVQGEKVNTTAFVLRREKSVAARRDSIGMYFRLVKEMDSKAKRLAFEQALERRRRGEANPHAYEYRQGDFAAISGSPWVYWITTSLRDLFLKLPKIAEVAKPCVGINTNDNVRFLRKWWEVGLSRIGRSCPSRVEAEASGNSWFPYMKGGQFSRWWGNQELVVNWANDGAQIKAWAVIRNKGQHWSRYVRNISKMFQRGVTWTDVTAGRFSARLSPGGFIFDVKGSSAFPDDVPMVLGLLNSSFANYVLNLINPTVSYQVGDIARLPVPKSSDGPLRDYVDHAIALASEDSKENETTYNFVAPPDWLSGTEAIARRHQKLSELEHCIDEEIYHLYQISDKDQQAIATELAAPTPMTDAEENTADSDDESEAEQVEESSTQSQLAARWIRYAIGVSLGRFQPGVKGGLGCGRFSANIAGKLLDLADKDGIMVLEAGHPDDLAKRVLEILIVIYGDAIAEQMTRSATNSTASLREALEAYLAGDFFKDHVKRYRKRPIYWLIQSPKKNYSIYLFHEKATADTMPLLRGNRYLGGRINRLQQEHAAQIKAASTASDRKTVAKLTKGASEIAELLEELKEFDRRLEDVTRVPIKDREGRDTTVRWEPELDDGVYINAAPLYELLPSWREVNPKKAWQELTKEEYDWSKTAMRYWPQRVLEKCKQNKSYAIAHGLA